jgi:hypothetical protein
MAIEAMTGGFTAVLNQDVIVAAMREYWLLHRVLVLAFDYDIFSGIVSCTLVKSIMNC